MSNRPRFRPSGAGRTKAAAYSFPHTVRALPPLDLRAQVLPSRLGEPENEWVLAAGAQIAMRVTATTRAPAVVELDIVRSGLHDELVRFVDDEGGQRLGPVEWLVYTPDTIEHATELLEVYPEVRAAHETHPEGWVIAATVVAIPPGQAQP